VSLKSYCLVPDSWTLKDCESRTCSDGSHVHLSRRAVLEMERDGAIEWLHHPVNRRDKGVVRVRRQLFVARGLSCRVGAPLAVAVALGEVWAGVMLDNIISSR